MEHMADGLKENYDEEVGAKENLARQLNKALGDSDMWKQKYEIDGIAKAEELEMAKLKMQVKLSQILKKAALPCSILKIVDNLHP